MGIQLKGRSMKPMFLRDSGSMTLDPSITTLEVEMVVEVVVRSIIRKPVGSVVPV
jgi:hypothetical protein